MNIDTTSAPRAVSSLIAALMRGETLPPTGSPEFATVIELIGGFQRFATDSDYAMLGHLALGALIDAGRARITSDEVLRQYGKGAM
jgi:hypothetical protein